MSKRCVQLFKKTIMIEDSDILIEPSAGTGSFVKHLNECKGVHLYYDIDPKSEEILKQDFLEMSNDSFKCDGKIHVIGNPPFGRQASFAKKFIRKACEFCDTISFILPKSFKKESMNKCFENHFHLIVTMDLPNNSFIKNEKECCVPTCFQIWRKTEKIRRPKKKEEPNGYHFVKKDEADMSFRRVGFYAGRADTRIDDKSIQSHYFIKFDEKIDATEIVKMINDTKFADNNTVGAKSISKQEFIKCLNQIIPK